MALSRCFHWKEPWMFALRPFEITTLWHFKECIVLWPLHKTLVFLWSCNSTIWLLVTWAHTLYSRQRLTVPIDYNNYYLFIQSNQYICGWTKWYMKWIIYWIGDMKLSEAAILWIMNAMLAIAWKKSEPVTSWCWCDALTNWAMSHRRWKLVICGFKCSRDEWIKGRNDIWNEFIS